MIGQGLFLRFDHDPQQGFGTRGPNQNTPLARERDVGLGLNISQSSAVLPVMPRLQANVDQALREQADAIEPLCNGALTAHHSLQYLQRTHNAITRRVAVQRNEVARPLAP